MTRTLAAMLTFALIFLAANSAGASIIVAADFDGSTASDFATADNADALTASNLNAGTTGGTWTVNSNGSTDEKNSYIEHETGNEANKALVADRGLYDFRLDIDTVPTLATDMVEVSFDTEVIRTTGDVGDPGKRNFVTLFDTTDTVVAQIVVNASTDAGNETEIRYVDSTGTEQVVATDLPSVGGNPVPFDPADFTSVSIDFSATTMDIFVNGTLEADDALLRNAGVTNIAYLTLTGADTLGSNASRAGAYYDNIVVDAIPEPASLALLGLGGLVLLRRRRIDA